MQHRLTQDHKPENPKEKERIEDAGGVVNYASETARIGMLRCIAGDKTNGSRSFEHVARSWRSAVQEPTEQ